MNKTTTQDLRVAITLEKVEAYINAARGTIPQANPQLRKALMDIRFSKTTDPEAISVMSRREAGLAEGIVMSQLMETLKLDTDPFIAATVEVDKKLEALERRVQSDWRITPKEFCEGVTTLAAATRRPELAEVIRDFSTVVELNTTQ